MDTNKNAVTTKRPVTQSGWYETTDGQAAYFQSSFGHRSWKPGMASMICTEVRSIDSVSFLVDVLL